MDETLRLLADEMAVRNVIARLAILADRGPDDLVEYLSLWTEDGVYDVREPVRHIAGTPSKAKVIRGRDALRRDRTMLRQTGFQGPGTDTWHINTTLHVRIVTATEARSESIWLLADGRDQPSIRRVGHYDDTLRRTALGWQLAYRVVTPNGA